MAFSQSVTQGGLLLNYKEALRMIHIDSEHKADDMMDLAWIIRKPANTRNVSPLPISKGTTQLGFNYDNEDRFASHMASLAKRAKTPMLTRTIDAAVNNNVTEKDKMNLTLTGIDKMDQSIKRQLEGGTNPEVTMDDELVREDSRPRGINTTRLRDFQEQQDRDLANGSQMSQRDSLKRQSIDLPSHRDYETSAVPAPEMTVTKTHKKTRDHLSKTMTNFHNS